jgi:NTP pyrophosphatase (non-canonical NTP hydrolase)
MSDLKIQEALDLIQEECAEIIQIISKIRRFGFSSYNPYDPSGDTNLELLHDEIGDFLTLYAYLRNDMKIIDSDLIHERKKYKREKLHKTSNLFAD